MSDDLRGLAPRLRTCTFGRAHEHHAELGSTNDRAAAWIREGAPHGAVVTADAQTAGRGRRGRSWVSPPGENLYVSVVLRPDAVRDDFSAIGLAVGVGLAAGLPGDVELKWPNDLLLGGRKVGGILCESRWLGPRPDVVIGFGINVHQRAFDPSIETVATSLALQGHETERAKLLAGLLLALEDAVDTFVAEGFAAVRSRYEGRCGMLGRTVSVALGDETVQGVAESIDDGGALCLRGEDRSLRRVEVGDVSVP